MAGAVFISISSFTHLFVNNLLSTEDCLLSYFYPRKFKPGLLNGNLNYLKVGGSYSLLYLLLFFFLLRSSELRARFFLSTILE